MPLVAIVTPVYNGAAFLEKAMASIQNQTYRNLVHIVLDNASTDGSFEIAERFRGSRVPVELRRNETLLPLQENWNKAFSFVPREAKYVKLNCADDLIRPDAIERMVELAEKDTSVEVVLSDDVFDNRQRKAWLDRNTLTHDGKSFARRILEESIGWLPYQHFFVRVHPQDLGSGFCGPYQIPDPYVVVRSAIRGRVGYIPEPLVYTRVHEGTASKKEVKAGGIKLYMAPLFLWKEFGEAIYGSRKKSSFHRRFTAKVSRIYLFMKAKGWEEAARTLRREVESAGEGIGYPSVIRAIATYPFYRLQKTIQNPPGGSVIREDYFLDRGRPG